MANGIMLWRDPTIPVAVNEVMWTLPACCGGPPIGIPHIVTVKLCGDEERFAIPPRTLTAPMTASGSNGVTYSPSIDQLTNTAIMVQWLFFYYSSVEADQYHDLQYCHYRG